jgi:hypothetical protein
MQNINDSAILLQENVIYKEIISNLKDITRMTEEGNEGPDCHFFGTYELSEEMTFCQKVGFLHSLKKAHPLWKITIEENEDSVEKQFCNISTKIS